MYCCNCQYFTSVDLFIPFHNYPHKKPQRKMLISVNYAECRRYGICIKEWWRMCTVKKYFAFWIFIIAVCSLSFAIIWNLIFLTRKQQQWNNGKPFCTRKRQLIVICFILNKVLYTQLETVERNYHKSHERFFADKRFNLLVFQLFI